VFLFLSVATSRTLAGRVCCRITNQLVKLFGAALKKAAKKKSIFFSFISCLGIVVLRVVKVLGVGVTVEVWLHGVKNVFLMEWCAGASGEGVTVEVGLRGVGVTVEVGLR
jgi:hypothetical protein